jgi:hypothetical protein
MSGPNTEKGRLDNMLTGNSGGKYIANTDATTPETGYVFTSIYVVSNAAITTVGNITGITAVNVAAGLTIHGRFTSITLGSGAVIAYNGI